MSSLVGLWICVTCRRSMAPGVAPAIATDGRALFDVISLLLDGHAAATSIALRSVECMGGCERSCTAALTATGKPSYLFGDLEPSVEHAVAVLDGALMYAERSDGLLPRIDRPRALRTGILSRIPAHAKL
jgi:predicted metal-binding protein